MAHFTRFVCCCGASTISGVSTTKPEKIIHDYLTSQQGSTRFDPAMKKYVKTEDLRIKDAFIIWADPDRPDPTSKSGWGTTSSGKILCEYIVKHRLGSVTKTPLRHNPMHPERKPGNMDLRIWIWNLNPIACQKWWDRHKSVTPPPVNTGVKSAAVNVPRVNAARKGAVDDIPF